MILNKILILKYGVILIVVKEIWRDIPNFENKYQVSNLGNISALNYHKENKIKILKQRVDKYGYKRIGLYQNGKYINFAVHRLVINAFVGKSDLTVNHIDEDKTNNRLENLEYMTIKENVRYSQARKFVGININTGEKFYFNSTREVEEKGFNQRSTIRVLKGEYLQHKGYTFKYLWEKEKLKNE